MGQRTTMQSSDVFQGRSRLERVLVHETTPPDDEQGLPAVGHLEQIESDLADVRERVAAVEARIEGAVPAGRRLGAEPASQECEYLVYIASPEGYRLSETTGRLADAGEVVAGAGATVLHVGRSPFPDDPRPCVFALPG